MINIVLIPLFYLAIVPRINEQVPFPIFFKELNVTITHFGEFPVTKTLTSEFYNIEYYKIELNIYNLKGEADFSAYNNNGELMLKGSYQEGLGVLRGYVTNINPLSGESLIDILEFYQPLPSGLWIFYNNYGEVLENRKYLRGLIIEE